MDPTIPRIWASTHTCENAPTPILPSDLQYYSNQRNWGQFRKKGGSHNLHSPFLLAYHWLLPGFLTGFLISQEDVLLPT